MRLPAPTPSRETSQPDIRERLQMHGPARLADAELLALVLGTGTAGRPVEALAAHALRVLGGLNGLCQARPGELSSLCGIGPTKAARLLSALELGRRATAAPIRCGQRIEHSRRVFEVFGPGLRHAKTEQFWAIALDVRHRVRALLPIASGTLSACPVAPADVFRPLIREAAAATIVLHNHPSGDPTPSPEDEALTETLQRAGHLMGVQLLDHVIVGHDNYYSFLDAGGMTSRERDSR